MEVDKRVTMVLKTMVEKPLPKPGWGDWAELQQRMAGETTHLFQAILEQQVSNKNTANLKLWDAITGHWRDLRKEMVTSDV